jgi:hypothetical protein
MIPGKGSRGKNDFEGFVECKQKQQWIYDEGLKKGLKKYLPIL